MKNQTNKNLIKTIKFLAKILSKYDYALIGSLNLHIQGIEIEPRDIDILTTEKDVFEIEKELKKYQTKKVYFDKEDGRNSYRGLFKINEIEVEILGNVKKTCRPKTDLKKKISVRYRDFLIYAIPLKQELEFYKKCKKTERVKQITTFIHSRELENVN